MLSRVITSWGGMSIATTRSETVWTLVSRGGRNRSPGPFAPHERPSTNSTPRSYSLNTRSPERTYRKTTPMAAASMRSMASGREGFHDHGRALSAPDARRAEPEAPLGVAQRVEQVDRNARAGRGEGMPDCDGAAMHVRLVAVQAQLLLHCEILRRERLVHLHQVHLLELHLGLLERLACRRCGSDAHVLGLHSRHGPRDQTAQRLQAMRLGVLVARDHRGRGPVHYP